ncbi:MAG: hypothetical protein IPN12_14405 [Rhodocyclaceae bacterium]|nr:hypothetical protein [Rhodocyclaceae bacterium]
MGTVIALMLSLPALAMPPKRITAAEKALLPPYCKFTQGGYLGSETTQQYSSGATRWIDAFGRPQGGQLPYLWRMHHYCYALIHMMRGERAGLTRMEYKEAWVGALDELDFTLQFLPADFVLMPEMLLNRGRIMMRLKKPDAAMENFAQAISAKADYWPPYLEIADYQVSVGAKAKAIETLQEGLRKAPDAKALRLRLKELGGAMPEPAMEKQPTGAPSPSSERP